MDEEKVIGDFGKEITIRTIHDWISGTLIPWMNHIEDKLDKEE